MPELNQKLEQKLSQKLSPQQIQLIKLLEVPIIELEQRIKKEIEDNPALEEGLDEDEIINKDQNEEIDDENETEIEDETSIQDEIPVEDNYDDDEIPNYKLKDNNYAEETESAQTFYSVGASFQEFLYNQLSELELDEKKQKIAEYIIGCIDDSGYLTRQTNSIVSDLLFLFNIKVTIEEVEDVLKKIQEELDPPGVGAKNLKECLLIQIKRKLKDKPDNEILKLSYTILNDYFDIFSKKHYEKIKAKLDIDNDKLRQIINEILKLNPKPGNAYAPQAKKNIYQIVPDFILQIRDSEPYIELNSVNVPHLKVNKTYEAMISSFQGKKETKKSDKDAITFIKQKVDSAKWFIDAIQQRQNTLEKTMNAILEYQKEFFKTGDERKLKPMILKDIAEKTGLDISTISRVANSKYIQTPYGIYPLKFFFSEGMENSDGEEVSTRKIKKILKEAIENENKQKPLTDEKLAQVLQEKGFKIARRTVAKYREQMGILVARLRKEI
jgi:RNA polymerase sigma-54 factor